jgi:hypothetical protein
MAQNAKTPIRGEREKAVQSARLSLMRKAFIPPVRKFG